MKNEKVQEILSSILKEKVPSIKQEELALDTDIKQLGLDSLDFIEVIYSIETSFEIEISPEFLPKINTVQSLIWCIETELSKKNGLTHDRAIV